MKARLEMQRRDILNQETSFCLPVKCKTWKNPFYLHFFLSPSTHALEINNEKGH